VKERVNSSTFDRECSPILLNDLQMICFYLNFANSTVSISFILLKRQSNWSIVKYYILILPMIIGNIFHPLLQSIRIT